MGGRTGPRRRAPGSAIQRQCENRGRDSGFALEGLESRVRANDGQRRSVLPSYSEVHAAARVVFFKVKANEIDRYSDYKKFSSEVKLGVSTPVETNPKQ